MVNNKCNNNNLNNNKLDTKPLLVLKDTKRPLVPLAVLKATKHPLVLLEALKATKRLLVLLEATLELNNSNPPAATLEPLAANLALAAILVLNSNPLVDILEPLVLNLALEVTPERPLLNPLLAATLVVPLANNNPLAVTLELNKLPLVDMEPLVPVRPSNLVILLNLLVDTLEPLALNLAQEATLVLNNNPLVAILVPLVLNLALAVTLELSNNPLVDTLEPLALVPLSNLDTLPNNLLVDILELLVLNLALEAILERLLLKPLAATLVVPLANNNPLAATLVVLLLVHLLTLVALRLLNNLKETTLPVTKLTPNRFKRPLNPLKRMYTSIQKQFAS